MLANTLILAKDGNEIELNLQFLAFITPRCQIIHSNFSGIAQENGLAFTRRLATSK